MVFCLIVLMEVMEQNSNVSVINHTIETLSWIQFGSSWQFTFHFNHLWVGVILYICGAFSQVKQCYQLVCRNWKRLRKFIKKKKRLMLHLGASFMQHSLNHPINIFYRMSFYLNKRLRQHLVFAWFPGMAMCTIQRMLLPRRRWWNR